MSDKYYEAIIKMKNGRVIDSIDPVKKIVISNGSHSYEIDIEDWETLKIQVKK